MLARGSPQKLMRAVRGLPHARMDPPKASRKQRPGWVAPDPQAMKHYEETAKWRDAAVEACTAATLRTKLAVEALSAAKSALEKAAFEFARASVEADKASSASVVAMCEQRAATNALNVAAFAAGLRD